MKRVIIIVLCLAACVNTFSQEDLKDSLAVAIDHLAYHPDSIDLRLKKAGWNLELHQWEYAKQEYDYVLRHDPQNIAALYYRAYTNEQLKRYGFARLDYENMLTLVPGNFEGRLGLALLNEKDQHYTEAMDQLNHLCESLPRRPEAFAARAGVEVDHKMLYPAEYDYTEALKLDPDNKDYLLSRADLRIKLNMKQEALEDLCHLEKLGIIRAQLKDLYDKCR